MEPKNLLKRRVLRDDVAEYLMESILTGALNPGDKIIESKLARELSISQGAVREAIRDLIAQGVLETEPYKGTRIRTLTKEQLNDYYDVRTEIEALAVRWSIVRHQSKYLDLDYLKSCVDSMKHCVEINDSKNMRKHDMAFHLAIIKERIANRLKRPGTRWETITGHTSPSTTTMQRHCSRRRSSNTAPCTKPSPLPTSTPTPVVYGGIISTPMNCSLRKAKTEKSIRGWTGKNTQFIRLERS